MADKSYVVRLVDCLRGRSGGVEGDAGDILAALKTWFAQVCQAATSKDTSWTADVQWMEDVPITLPGADPGDSLSINLILFFVPSTTHSMIALHSSWNSKKYNIDSYTKELGMTWPTRLKEGGRTAISEIYLSRCRKTGSTRAEQIEDMTRIAFHESMHNQLFKDNSLHRGATGFRKAIPTGSSPDANNLKDMAKAIGTMIPQWADGLAVWRAKYMP